LSDLKPMAMIDLTASIFLVHEVMYPLIVLWNWKHGANKWKSTYCLDILFIL